MSFLSLNVKLNDDQHKEIELEVTSPHLSKQHEGCFHLTSVGVELKQGSDTGVCCLRLLDHSCVLLSETLLASLQVSEPRNFIINPS
ncbi:hypothetical protein P3L10_028702 [Capsicum annuum]